jgi:hypothetical protein
LSKKADLPKVDAPQVLSVAKGSIPLFKILKQKKVSIAEPPYEWFLLLYSTDE